jgi:hypothetical protein
MWVEFRKRWISLGLASILAATGAIAMDKDWPLKLEGTWVMSAAYEINADGTHTTNFGEHPQGLLIVDKAGPVLPADLPAWEVEVRFRRQDPRDTR